MYHMDLTFVCLNDIQKCLIHFQTRTLYPNKEVQIPLNAVFKMKYGFNYLVQTHSILNNLFPMNHSMLRDVLELTKYFYKRKLLKITIHNQHCFAGMLVSKHDCIVNSSSLIVHEGDTSITQEMNNTISNLSAPMLTLSPPQSLVLTPFLLGG